MIAKAALRYLLFSLAAVAISAASIVVVKDYGEISIWASIIAASAACLAAVLFLSITKKISEFETIKYLISTQWLTLLLFCLMAVLIDQSIYNMQHRIDYNNCSMALMLLAVVMTGSNSISLIMYVKTTKDHLNDSEVLMEKFDDSIKDLVNSICTANHQPPKYDTSKKGMFTFKKSPSPSGDGLSAKPRGLIPKSKRGSAIDGGKPKAPLFRPKKKNDDGTGGDGE
jgi:hypothetical protein